MASSTDLVTITPAMLAMAWVKPATTYYPGGTATGTLTAGEANCTVNYLPNTLAEYAGAPGATSAAVSTDPNYIFARTMKAGLEKTPYPVALPGDITSSDIITPVECNTTLVAPTVPTSPQ